MGVFPVGVEHPLDVAIERPHDAMVRAESGGVKKALPDSRPALGVG